MVEIQISVPEPIARLYSESEAGLVREVLLGAIRQVALTKLAEEKDNLREALDKIRNFEDKYKLSFSDFERNIRPVAGSPAIREGSCRGRSPCPVSGFPAGATRNSTSDRGWLRRRETSRGNRRPTRHRRVRRCA